MKTKRDLKIITKHYNELIKITKQHYFIGITNEWIIDNYYLLVEKENEIKHFYKNKKENRYLYKNINLVNILTHILEFRNYKIDQLSLIENINDYCKKNNIHLKYQEIKIIPVTLSIILINKLSEICQNESNELKEKANIDNIIKKIQKDYLKKGKIKLENYFYEDFYSSLSAITIFNDKIKKFGKNSNEIFKQFNKILESRKISLKDVINKEHFNNTNSNILVANIFHSIKQIDNIEIESLVHNLCDIEKILNKDPYYNMMTLETKNAYRRQLIKLAKKKKVDIIELTEKLINIDNNIGNVLFKSQNDGIKVVIYLLLVTVISVSLSILLSFYFIPVKWLGFLILLIPVSEIVITFLNKIYLKIFPPKPLAKLDFEKGIPKNYKTMVVIPTILKNKEKVDEVFNKLEAYYLANKSKNLYFTLLGDACESKTETFAKDDEVKKAGIAKVNELNKKYKEEIFYFAYRTRKYSESEGCHLGFERKRGALLHFNDLILNNMSEEEQNYWFQIHTFNNFKHKIKYVITLDVDTQLILNSALKLVGTMAHPINKPILNEEKTKVIKGYGILQPKISVDVESTNQSLFSQIYAGIGGLDPYSTIVPNFYQDVFSEGSFIGKGIYDLEVYQTILKGRFPNQLILSHDLLEGNYLRCGVVSDIELFDDFPSKFLVDVTRRSRWARGDMQVIGWIFRKVKDEKGSKYKNPINLLGKWKIIDNIRRSLLDFSLLLILICLASYSIVHPYWWLLFILFVVILPVISHIIQLFTIQSKNSKNLKYYNIMAFGYQAFILRTLSVFTSIPYNAYLYVKAFMTSLYRMLISKKHLLQWMTAEDASKKVKTNLANHIRQFWVNYVASLAIIILAIFVSDRAIECFIIALFFMIAPFLAYAISEDIKSNNRKIKANDFEYLNNVAKLTWNFFKDNLTLENNCLIPDNYQLNREKKADYKTSPTNIGLSLTSILSAYELGFISKKETINYLDKIINTVEKLPKWNGHLYNWYRIDTLEVILPHFISTVDSGNFIASLITVKEFLYSIKENSLAEKVQKLIKKTDFSKLYTKEDVFSIGYNVDEGVLEPFNYNKFASESRITSYLAIAKGDVPSKHWFNLDKTLTTYKRKKGLVSWSGTSFEYFMPLLFIPTYDNTLIDESYDFAFYTQKEFMKEVNKKLPWGISESAYNELDDAQNYKYKAFATPYLKLQEDSGSRIVISPYSSILALSLFPTEVLTNMKKLESLNLLGKYGFYESYDVDDEAIVYSYFAHHQGMILGSIANTLKSNILQKYFVSDINNNAFEILNKEKVQLKPIIDVNITKYKKYSYDKEPFVNDIRVFHQLSTLPEVSVLSNSKYSVFMNDRGNGFSRYRTIQLNRYRKITEQDYGMFLYIKDTDTNYVWSNTYAPINKMPEKYEVVFALDKMKFIRLDHDIITTTEVVVTKTHHAEIRKITFKNIGDKDKNLELTSYTEPILSENMDDISHKTFQNLFVQSEYDEENKSVIMHRKLRDSDTTYYLINKLLINDNSEISYETNRNNFIGRNRTGANPIGLDKELSNKSGTCIDPIISLRSNVKIKANSEKSIYLISGFGKSKEQVLEIVKTFSNPDTISEKAFEVATIMSNVTNKMVDISGHDMRLYNTMLNYLYQTSHIIVNNERKEILHKNVLNQTGLWKFGISGDRPIILLEVEELDNLSLVKELLHAFEYYKSKSIFIDLIILNSYIEQDKQIINDEIDNEKYHMYALNSFNKTPGNIYVINPDDVNEDEINLFKTTARIYINSSKFHSLEEFVLNLQKLNTISRKETVKRENSLPIEYNKDKLVFYNGYGGFCDNGKKYVITNPDTPLIWCNILANENFGSIVSNNQTGFTYAENSREYKLTSWTNDPLLADASEGIKINDIHLKYQLTEVSFGKMYFIGKWKDLEFELTQFVATNDPIKFYYLKIKNTGKNSQKIKLNYWINPCLGVTEEKTSRYILSEFNKEENCVILKNKYSQHFSNLVTLMSCTLPIEDAKIKRILSKEIETYVEVDSNEDISLCFMLASTTEDNIDNLLNKYNSINKIKNEEKNVEKYWQNMLNTIQVKTSDDSFNYMINGWLAYQAITSRIYSKAGFYQVGGAYGYRDQLQDCMNICTIHPEMTRQQILFNAKHQFQEGDVLHWWHKENRFGLRSRYKDDYLWLIYATSEYLDITQDYSILDEQICFVDGPILSEKEMEKGMEYSYTEKTDSLYEHCLLALKLAKNEIGENGLPLMRGGDWNDGMNKVGEEGKGTSVWLGFFLYQVLEKFINFTTKYNKKIDVEEWVKFKNDLANSLKNNAWDGEYYLRAFFDNNNKLGSKSNLECKIDLISQSFSILSGIASDEQIPSILNAVDKQLVDKNLKIVKLLWPAFQHNKDNPGYIMNYPPGIRENGGQYTHAVAWYIQTLIKVGDYDSAYQIYQMINPIERTKEKNDTDIYQLEPYVIAADIYSNSDFPAKGGWSWYTGSAGWFYRVALIDILGFNKVGNKLYIKPHVPNTWNKFEIIYKFNDSTYHLLIEKSKNNSITVDNNVIKKDYIELIDDGDNHEVIVKIGGNNVKN